MTWSPESDAHPQHWPWRFDKRKGPTQPQTLRARALRSRFMVGARPVQVGEVVVLAVDDAQRLERCGHVEILR